MWNSNTNSDIPLQSIIGSLILAADHPLSIAEIRKVIDDVELARKAQAAEIPDVTDAELEAAQAEADIAAGRTLGAIPKAEAAMAGLQADRPNAAQKTKSGDDATPKSCSAADVKNAIAGLRKTLANLGLGLEIVEINGCFRFQTVSDCGPWVRQLLNKGRATVLSRPAVETLAIIAYRQPVSRSEIESVRGVNAGHVIKALMEMQLVRIVGRSDLPGRPFLFGTTPLFLEHFGLKSLDELENVQGAKDLARDTKEMEKKPAAPGLSLKVK